MLRRGDPRPTGYAWRQMTLGKLMRAGVMCRIRCDDCGHEAVHSPIWLVAMGNSWFGDMLYEVAQRLMCRRCLGRAVSMETAPDVETAPLQSVSRQTELGDKGRKETSGAEPLIAASASVRT